MGAERFDKAVDRLGKVYKALGVSDSSAEHEVVTHYLQANVSDPNFLSKMARYNQSSFYRLYNNLSAMLKGDAKSQIENTFMRAVRNANNAMDAELGLQYSSGYNNTAQEPVGRNFVERYHPEDFTYESLIKNGENGEIPSISINFVPVDGDIKYNYDSVENVSGKKENKLRFITESPNESLLYNTIEIVTKNGHELAVKSFMKRKKNSLTPLTNAVNALASTSNTRTGSNSSNPTLSNGNGNVNQHSIGLESNHKQKAIDEFGTTYDYRKAAYILDDGRYLDFSGGQQTRMEDHRYISQIYDESFDSMSDYLTNFMNEGNIRVMPETGAIDISSAVEPTNAQYKKINDFLDHYWKEWHNLDITDANGNTVASVEYPPRTSARKVINDIKQFFKDGTVPTVNNEMNQFRYSVGVTPQMDAEYEKAVKENDQDTVRQLVDEAAEMAGFIPIHNYHGSMNASFQAFDKSKAQVGGNSGAGFYFTNNVADATDNYSDVEGADNYFKWSALADKILDDGEWNGEPVMDINEATRIAKKELSKKPGVFDVYLKYSNPYTRDFRNSTNIFNKIYDDASAYADSVIEREDYDSDDDYEDALTEEIYNQVYDDIYKAVYGAYQDLESNYEVLDGPDVATVAGNIAQNAMDYNSITWDDIKDAAYDSGEGYYVTNDGWDEGADGTLEFVRAVIENFGFDAVIDKEVDKKFNQLMRGYEGTEHTIQRNLED